MSALPDHAPILQTGFGFWPSQVLLTAVQLDVFSALAKGGLSRDELGRRLGLKARRLEDFFDTLVALGFLERDGDGAAGIYRNAPMSQTYLVRDGERFIGGILEMLQARLYTFWHDLPEALRTGEPQNEVHHSGKPMFDELYADPARLEQFLNAMRGISRLNFEAFADKFDFSRFHTLCDVGGATGLLSSLVAMRHPHMRCTSFDLPIVEPVAKKFIAADGVADRVGTASGDFFADPLPQAEVITMGMILHDWDLEKKMHLIRSAYAALPKGGAFVAIENLIDDQRRENAFGMLMSLNMLIEFGTSFDYTGAEFGEWCREVGFARTEVLHLTGPASAAIAYK